MSANPDLHTFTARMPAEDYEALRAYAFYAGISINEAVKRAVRGYLTAAATEKTVERMMEQARERFRAALGRVGDH